MQDIMLGMHKKMCFGTNNEAPRPLGFKMRFDQLYPSKWGSSLSRGEECSVWKGNKIRVKEAEGHALPLRTSE